MNKQVNQIIRCDECGGILSEGHYVEEGVAESYYCGDCLGKAMTEAEYNELYEEGLAYYTEWEYEPIGVWTLTNTLAVEVLAIEYDIEDVAVIREPDGTISEYTIQYDTDGTPYIQVGEIQLNFDECMRV